MSELREIWSEQYGIPCVAVENPNTANAFAVIAMCEGPGAVRDEDPEGREYCVELRNEIGPELWTESALKRSCKGA